MCLACLEYIKGNLKLNEFKSALGETIREGGDAHTQKVEEALYKTGGNEDDLKKQLKVINPGN
jgi:hypothetical protein